MLKKQISLKLTAPQYVHIQDWANAEKTTLTDVVRQLIDNDRRQSFTELKSISEMNRLHSRFDALIKLLADDDSEGASS